MIHVLRTRSPVYSPLRAFSLDLHVLGTPPAFVLSQDQTLQLKTSHRSVSSCADVIPILLPIHSKHCGSAICFVDLLSSFQGPNLTATADDRLRDQGFYNSQPTTQLPDAFWLRRPVVTLVKGGAVYLPSAVVSSGLLTELPDRGRAGGALPCSLPRARSLPGRRTLSPGPRLRPSTRSPPRRRDGSRCARRASGGGWSPRRRSSGRAGAAPARRAREEG